VIQDLNGLLLNPIRQGQFTKICEKYSILLKPTQNLTYHSAYLSGLIDRDGSIYCNNSSGQILVSVTQKHRYLLDLLSTLYGGAVYPQLIGNNTSFKWSI